MAIPPDIRALVDRLNQKLYEIEQEATQGLNLARPALSRFPDNAILVQYFAYLNAALLSVEIFRKQVQTIVEAISLTNATADIQGAGEDLRAILGSVLETLTSVRRIISLLERL